MSGDLGESDPQAYPSGGATPQPYPPDGGSDPQPRTTWVGRATARAPVPPLEHTGYLAPPPQVVVVEVPRRRSGGRMVLVSLGIVAAFCAIGATALLVTQALLRGAPGAAAPPAPGRTTPEPAPAPTPTRPGLNTPVRDGMLQFTITRVSCGHRAVAVSVINRKAHGQFCLVDVNVVNVGKDSRGFAEAFQKATGTNGTTYTPDSAAGLIVNSGGKTLWSTVNPGNRVTGTIVFDIPSDTRLASLELHDSPFSDGTTVTLA